MDKQLEQYLKECVLSFGEEYIDVKEEMQTPHKFSRHFRQKMHKLIRQRSSSFSIAKVPRKRRLSMAITLSILIFLSLTTAVICGGRNLFSGFYAEVFADNIIVQNIPQENTPATIEEIYMPTWIPEGYELVESDTDLLNYYRYFYCNNPDCEHHSYRSHICFEQKTKKEYHIKYDNENSASYQVTVNDYSGILFDDSDIYYIVWSDDDYTFEVSAPVELNKNDAFKIAESIQKVE